MKEKNSSLDNKCIIFITGKPIFVENLIQFFIHFPYPMLEQNIKWKYFIECFIIFTLVNIHLMHKMTIQK